MIIYTFYHPTVTLLELGNLEVSHVDEQDILEDVCEKNDIVYIDLTNDFYAAYEIDYILEEIK